MVIELVSRTAHKIFSEELRSRTFCKMTVAIVAICLSIVAAVNFIVDPYAQYGTNVVPPIVHPTRAQKVQLLAAANPTPNALVIGSSRVMKLEPKYLNQQTGQKFFNAGVNFGKPEDWLAILRHYQSTFERSPECIVLGIDIAAFSDHNKTDARLLSNADLLPHVANFVPISDRFNRWRELISWQQSKMSLESLRHHRSHTFAEPDNVFVADGLIHYPKREREIAAGEYNFQVAIDYNKREYKQLFAGFDAVSDRRLQITREFFQACSKASCNLYVFSTPMHPELSESLASTTSLSDRKLDVHEAIQDLADEFGALFFDLSSIDAFDGDATQFVDGVHPLEPNTRKMIRCILGAAEGQYALQ